VPALTAALVMLGSGEDHLPRSYFLVQLQPAAHRDFHTGIEGALLGREATDDVGDLARVQYVRVRDLDRARASQYVGQRCAVRQAAG
jgi:hypothetical protein